MASLQARAKSGPVACAAATAKTLLQLVAPTNQRVKITNISISSDGITPTAIPMRVRILRQTTAGTGGSAVTPVLVEPELTETIQTTALSAPTAEPTAGAVLRDFVVPQYMGNYEFFLPMGQEWMIGGGGRIGIEITASASVNVSVEAQFEE